MNFDAYFRHATGFGPLPWQRAVATGGLPDVLSVPTGLGKTEGVVLSWSWRRNARDNSREPRHLIYCLPMRVLVRQTIDRLRACFARLRESGIGPEIPVYQLMGGDIEEEWEGRPEVDWVIVGTQDQLLSRALNRGYCATSQRWPVHFGVLNNDCRWVLDEIQLMGPGLWTSAQLDWMRTRRFGSFGPSRTTWMSATVGMGFLDTRDRRDDEGLSEAVPMTMSWDVPQEMDEDTKEHLERLRDARRVVEQVSPPKKAARAKWLAREVVGRHAPGTLSLVICNTVAFAQEVFAAIQTDAPTVLLTSRFRGVDRHENERRLNNFEDRRKAAKTAQLDGDPGLVCISTQVVEAGVDVSAHRLWSETAPWPSLVQRLGRLNRDGSDNDARACFLTPERPRSGSNRIGPYLKSQVKAAGQILEELARLSATTTFRQAIAALEEGPYAEKITEALGPKRTPLPRAADVHGLFSTEPDVFGGFTDVSEFVRSPDPNADVTVFWRTWEGRNPDVSDLEGPPFDAREEGCRVGTSRLVKLLGDGGVAWRWEGDRRGVGGWIAVRASEVRPGMALMLEARQGGYDVRLGWTGLREDVIADLPPPARGPAWDDDQGTKTEYWASLASHLSDAHHHARRLVDTLDLPPDIEQAVIDAARFHDLGKAHPNWQNALPGRCDTELLAKSPEVLAVTVDAGHRESVRSYVEDETCLGTAAQPLEPGSDGNREMLRWALRRKLSHEQLHDLRRCHGVFYARHTAFRPGLRHEAASALAMWKARGDHGLSGLAVYLIACHHGKVRTVLRSRTLDGDDVCGVPREPGELEHAGTWPLAFEIAGDGAAGEWTDGGFRITAPGWTGVVAELLGPARPGEPEHVGALPEGEPRCLGPFRLAYLEALARAADWRATDKPTAAKYPGDDDTT